MSSSESSKHGSVESHGLGEQPKDLDIWLRFAGSGQRRPSHLQIVVAVGEVKVGMFQERRHRQHDVRVIRCIGLKLFQDDREQIFAPQAFEDRVSDSARSPPGSSCKPPCAFTGGSSTIVQGRGRAGTY